MPVVVRPGFVWPPDEDPIVSPDGFLTLIRDQSRSGVLLRADYSSDPTVKQVRFMRDDVPVRSGDPAWAPGGWAHAYDFEMPLGAGASWTAVPIRWDGTEGPSSAGVSAQIYPPEDGTAWVKSVIDPNQSMVLPFHSPDFDFESRVTEFSVPGQRSSVATWDIARAGRTTLSLLADDKATEVNLMKLLDSGPLLIQASASAGIPEEYFLAGDRKWEHQHWDGYPVRRVTFMVHPVARPATRESRLRIPDLSYNTVGRDWTSYTQLAGQVESYNSLLEVD